MIHQSTVVEGSIFIYSALLFLKNLTLSKPVFLENK